MYNAKDSYRLFPFKYNSASKQLTLKKQVDNRIVLMYKNGVVYVCGYGGQSLKNN